MLINDLDVWADCKFFNFDWKENILVLFSRAEEVKEHPYFEDMDWKRAYLLKLTPSSSEINVANI